MDAHLKKHLYSTQRVWKQLSNSTELSKNLLTNTKLIGLVCTSRGRLGTLVLKIEGTNRFREEQLLKVAYTGAPSRAIFPLTEEFSKISNNSFCAMNAYRTIIQNTDAYEGPYYVCDVNVKSEYCAALFGSGQNNFNQPDEKDEEKIKDVTGLVDAEVWRVNAFTDEVVADLESLGSFAGQLFKQGVVLD